MDTAALEQLRQAVQAAPQDIEARLALLQALITAEAWPEAEAVGTDLLHSPSSPAAASALMGIVYGKCHRVEEAVQQCRQALQAQPDDPLLQYNLGTLLAQQGNTEAALEHLEKAVAQREDWAEAHYNLGTVLLRQARYREAIEAFERALDHQETYPEAHFSRGNAHAMQGLDADGTLDYYEVDCAINAYKTAIQQRPGYAAALYNLGMVYGRMTSSEGVRVWEQYLETATDRPEEETYRMRAQEYKRDLQDRLR
jgi:tetratricopeptide (TPR) repeat protein